MASITATALVEAFPEWSDANTHQPDVVAQVVTIANARPLPLYTDSSEDTNRRLLEASALLFVRPFGRDMNRRGKIEHNWYRDEATRLDRLKGAQRRVPWADADGE